MKLYRYEDALGYDALECRLIEFEVIRETEKGYWFVESWLNNKAFESMVERSKRWVLKDARKRYCYPSKDEAWESYVIRKRKQLGHLKRQFNWAQQRVAYLDENPKVPEQKHVQMGHHGMIQLDEY